MNYSKSNNSRSPVKRGRLSDVVKLKRPLVTKMSKMSDKETVSELASDLVRILVDSGIIIKGTYKIARALEKCGWVKVRKIKRDVA